MCKIHVLTRELVIATGAICSEILAPIPIPTAVHSSQRVPHIVQIIHVLVKGIMDFRGNVAGIRVQWNGTGTRN